MISLVFRIISMHKAPLCFFNLNKAYEIFDAALAQTQNAMAP